MGDVPAIVKRHRHVRRGSVDAPPFVADRTGAAAVEQRLAEHRALVEAILDEPGTDERITSDGHAWLDGAPEASPLGAAAVVTALSTRDGHRAEGAVPLTPFADVWIVRHGLVFAARAAVEHAVLIGRERERPDPMRRGPIYLVPAERGEGGYRGPSQEILLRVRTAVAVATDTEYASVVEALRPYRDRGREAAVATSVLVPSEREWVAEDIRAGLPGAGAELLLLAAGTAAQVDALAPHMTFRWSLQVLRFLATIADGAGPGAAGAFLSWFDAGRGYADTHQRILSVVAELDGDAAFEGLLARLDQRYVPAAVIDAAARFPARAMRLFAEAGSPMLRAHVLAHLGLVDEVLPDLGPEAAARVRELADGAAAVTYAPAASIPPILASPPWQHRARPPKPVVITGLSCDDPETVEWRDGERDRWLDTPGDWGTPWLSWERVARAVATNHNVTLAPMLFTGGPEELARPLLATWRSHRPTVYGDWLKVTAARFGIDALPLVRSAAESSAASTGALLPYSSPEIAVFMADRFARMKSARPAALAWLVRHAAVAARALIPVALGKAGTARRQAESALLALPADTVRAAAGGYGPAATSAIGALLERDPLTLLPARLAANPAWAVPAMLPPVHLRDGSGALPPAAVDALITMLAISRMDEPYAGVAQVAAACEPAGLAGFAWGLLDAWQAAGADPKQGWVLDALALLGDDTTVERLTPLILAWPGEGGHTKAVAGVRALATIGTDTALTRLYGISQRARFKGLKTAAEERITEVADGLGLTAEQLADRLVPDFGLAADGTLTLDYGPRQFVVGFDEQLRPYVSEAGRRLKDLPKPSTPQAEAARKRFTDLRKEVRTVAADQARRLERAMVTGRRWTPEEFARYFSGHPLLGHLVRRLIWTVSGGGSFRVCEDRSLAGADDEPLTLPGDVMVGVAHPLDLAGSLAAWGEVFADYEIVQPFPQLARETFAASGDDLKRFLGAEVPTARVLGLERQGWRRESPQDAGVQSRIMRTAGEFTVVVELDPGIAVGVPDPDEAQRLDDIHIDGRAGRHPFTALGPITASEVIRDLMLVAESAA
ncbi:DUF4132 domain-containing protein [Actinoplanes subglobosus]|uniref:DUF4132 domain-containing protein n=1 Tax=Actinoplanes subglobosus TaxID=1547892 RepID=A0ABV8ISV3_9ACTN